MNTLHAKVSSINHGCMEGSGFELQFNHTGMKLGNLHVKCMHSSSYQRSEPTIEYTHTLCGYNQ